MGEEGSAFEGLREAIDAFAAERAPELMAEARAEAVAKARSMLVEAMAEALLTRAGESLRPGGKARPSTSPSKRATERPAPGPSKSRPSPTRSRARSQEATPRPRRATTPSRPDRSRQQPDDEELGYYVYGVVSARDAKLPANLAGVDPRHPATVIEADGLGAIASRVSLAEFGEEQLHENLNDVEWLEGKARAHEEVLDAALSRMTVVPMRLCTIYRTTQQVHELLAREGDLFRDALERLEGKTEWGVKLVAKPDALQRAAISRGDLSPEPDAASEGTAYMNRKRREAQARDEEDQIAEEWAREVHERVAEGAAEALLNPVQRPEVSGYEGEMLLNGVYLVSDSDVDDFRRLVDRLADEYRERGALVELTGPWPPYNFVKSSIEAAR